MDKISYWHGAALGAGGTAGYLVWEFGWPPLDVFDVGLLIAVTRGGILGVAAEFKDGRR
jgi:hypothetical protein